MKTAVERFWEKVEKTSACWNWIGCVLRNGYGQFQYEGRVQYAHRVSYQMFKGKIPEGLVLDHVCRKTSCVNPLHLEAVTARENVLRGIGPAAISSRKEVCIRGHLFSEENTLPRVGRRGRRCRECARIIRKRWYKNNREYANWTLRERRRKKREASL